MKIKENFKKYLNEPALNIISDPKNLLIGSTLQFLSTFLMLLGFFSLFIFFMILGSILDSETNFLITIIENTLKLTPIMLLMVFGTIFGLFFIFSFLLIFLVNGYYIRTVKDTINGNIGIPDWNNIFGLLKKGISYTFGLFLLGIIFQIPVYLLSFGLIFLNFDIPELFISSFAFLLSFLSWTYIPLGTLNYIEKNKFLALFNFKKSFKLYSREYIGYLVLLLVLLGFYSLLEYVASYFLGSVIETVSLNQNLLYDTKFLISQLLWIPALYLLSTAYFTIYLCVAKGAGIYYRNLSLKTS